MWNEWKKQWFCDTILEMKQGMYALARGMLNNDVDAEDAIQNSILLAYEHLNELLFPGKIKAWIYKILTNECYKILQKRKPMADIEEVEVAETEHISIDDKVTLWDAIQSLTVEQRMVVLLYYYEGMRIKEIAKVVGATEGTIKKRLQRSREALKDLVQEGK